jgi:hypothetical protein
MMADGAEKSQLKGLIDLLAPYTLTGRSPSCEMIGAGSAPRFLSWRCTTPSSGLG